MASSRVKGAVRFFGFGMVGMLFIACSGGGGSSGAASFTCTAATPPVYTNDVQFILNNNCVSCHGTFNTYSGAVASASNIATQVNSGAMPKGGSLTASDKTAIIQWVACGTKQ